MSIVFDIHSLLGNTVMYYTATLTLWALWRIIRKQGMDSSFRGAMIIAGGLAILQGALGVVLYFFSGLELARQVHVLYGALSALIVPTAYVYTKGSSERREMVITGIAILVMAVLALRALMTAGMRIVLE
ncbi:MAG: hypothetical protein PHS96_06080 [Anaerolineales bacterium]|nr:hypothetical protein [Anaerolineales bacterium]